MVTIEQFLKGGIAVHCETKDEAKTLLKYLDRNGIIWKSGERIDVNSVRSLAFNAYKDKTVYHVHNGSLMYGNVESETFENNMKVVKLKNIVGLISVVNDTEQKESPVMMYKVTYDLGLVRGSAFHIPENRKHFTAALVGNPRSFKDMAKYVFAFEDDSIIVLPYICIVTMIPCEDKNGGNK